MGTKKTKSKLKMKRTTVSNLGRTAGGTSPTVVTVETVEAVSTVEESAAAAEGGGGILKITGKVTNVLTFAGGGGGGGGGPNPIFSGHQPSAGASKLNKG